MTERKRVTLGFFNQLREPERTQAIDNYDNAASNTVPYCIENAIMSGFDWEETPQGQGHKYWENIWESLIDKTYWPPVVFSIEDYDRFAIRTETKIPQPNPTELGILINEAINELEKPKWILVSDRLPSENDANMYSKVLSQKESGDIITMFFYQVTYQDFIAWQPLPDPYNP